MPRTSLRVFATPVEIGEYVAERILGGIATAEHDHRRFLLGLPTGRTPVPVYVAMARRLAETPQTLAHVTLVMMDEYLRHTQAGFEYATADDTPSCHAFTEIEIVGRLNATVPNSQWLRDDRVWFPDPRTPAEYDDRIAEAGGIDFFLLASGAGDGHVAFNPPDSALESLSRVVTLSERTRRDNLQTFPALGALANVPRFGVTVGIATMVAARQAIMMAWGDAKRETVSRMRAATRYDPSWPATLIHECSNAEIVVDEAAAGAPSR